MSARLLLLEDDPAIARTVAYALERDGLQVTHCLLVQDARQQMQRHPFDLLVLDVGLPDGNGLDLLRDVRHGQAAAGSSIAVVPLTIPLLTGPASMSTVVIYADRAQTFWQHTALVGYGVVIALATAVCFSLADPIARVLGKTGINVMTRLMGLILAALAVEVMTDGLGKIFPVLIAR